MIEDKPAIAAKRQLDVLARHGQRLLAGLHRHQAEDRRLGDAEEGLGIPATTAGAGHGHGGEAVLGHG